MKPYPGSYPWATRAWSTKTLTLAGSIPPLTLARIPKKSVGTTDPSAGYGSRNAGSRGTERRVFAFCASGSSTYATDRSLSIAIPLTVIGPNTS